LVTDNISNRLKYALHRQVFGYIFDPKMSSAITINDSETQLIMDTDPGNKNPYGKE